MTKLTTSLKNVNELDECPEERWTVSGCVLEHVKAICDECKRANGIA